MTHAVSMSELAILTPSRKPSAAAAEAEGALINPDDLSGVERTVLAVKPGKWREVASGLRARLPGQGAVVSVMAGVKAGAISEALGLPVARVMPTTAVAIGQGAAAVWSQQGAAASAVRDLFAPIARLVEVGDERLIDVATAVSGSGAAYVYAFVSAMAEAGRRHGLTDQAALTLAESTARGALAMMAAGGRSPDELIAEVASPGGTTQAALRVLERPGGLSDLMAEAVQAALDRARELGG